VKFTISCEILTFFLITTGHWCGMHILTNWKPCNPRIMASWPRGFYFVARTGLGL